MSKLPKLAIVGRPNVGKSALFNRIAGKRIAIVDEAEGITRDRLYAEGNLFGFPFQVIDTGGINPHSTDSLRDEIRRQALIAIEEADTLVMVVDGKIGITDLDAELAHLLLKTKKPLTLAINKIDAHAQESLLHQFYGLGISSMVTVSALHGFHIAELLEKAWADTEKTPQEEALSALKVAIVGRPNVGKSTLINALLDEKRCIVSPTAGTTRDSIDSPLTIEGKEYVLIDTAGIRRKQKERAALEKFSAIRTQEAIERADISLLLLDSQEGMTHQEKRIAKTIEKTGKGSVVVFNKWDLIKGFRMEHCLQMLKKESPFLAHSPILFISAKTGRNLDKLFPALGTVESALQERISTPQLNTFLEKTMQLCHPPMLRGKRLRVYYMTQIETAPPRFLLFVNHPDLMTKTYKKYLLNQFRKRYPFPGLPIDFILRCKKSSAYETRGLRSF